MLHTNKKEQAVLPGMRGAWKSALPPSQQEKET